MTASFLEELQLLKQDMDYQSPHSMLTFLEA